ncbi:hypothetical protein JI56_03915 [SAR11 cluster bacterium PRT-SC02]|nr:hypothetical protein JI56_03915 [SAR11 cluster bacterium PRT-SC02]
MKIFLKLLIIINVLLFLSSCGFKSLVQENPINLNIKNFITQKGDKKLGKIIRSDVMLYSSKEAKKNIDIILEIDKQKQIREKNLKNRVTKYNLTLNVAVFVKGDFEDKFTFNKTSSTTVTASSFNNFLEEERVYANLSKRIADDIKNMLALNY